MMVKSGLKSLVVVALMSFMPANASILVGKDLINPGDQLVTLNKARLQLHKSIMRYIIEVMILCLCYLWVFIPHLAAQEASPLALLRGVELSRTKYNPVRVTLEIQYISLPSKKILDCLVEQDGIKRRFEVLKGEKDRQTIIRVGNEFHAFRPIEHEDVEIYGLDRATGVRGDIAFDPRILGLSDLMPCNVAIKDCLWYENTDKLEVVGQELMRDIKVWRVKAIRNDIISEYWIEEPSFRVHKKVATTPFMRIEINSEFDDCDSQTPFPIRVTISRTSQKSEGFERIYSVKSFDLISEIPSDRFTTKSMDLPINTAFVDYRISRRIGYWDGEGLTEYPVYTSSMGMSR